MVTPSSLFGSQIPGLTSPLTQNQQGGNTRQPFLQAISPLTQQPVVKPPQQAPQQAPAQRGGQAINPVTGTLGPMPAPLPPQPMLPTPQPTLPQPQPGPVAAPPPLTIPAPIAPVSSIPFDPTAPGSPGTITAQNIPGFGQPGLGLPDLFTIPSPQLPPAPTLPGLDFSGVSFNPQGNGFTPPGLPALPNLPQANVPAPLAGLEQALQQALANPSGFDANAVQTAFDRLNSQLVAQNRLAQDQVTANAASRGVFFGTPLTTSLGDLSQGLANSQENLARDLLVEQARTFGQDRLGALAAASGFSNQQQQAALQAAGLNQQGALGLAGLQQQGALGLGSLGLQGAQLSQQGQATQAQLALQQALAQQQNALDQARLQQQNAFQQQQADLAQRGLSLDFGRAQQQADQFGANLGLQLLGLGLGGAPSIDTALAGIAGQPIPGTSQGALGGLASLLPFLFGGQQAGLPGSAIPQPPAQLPVPGAGGLPSPAKVPTPPPVNLGL